MPNMIQTLPQEIWDYIDEIVLAQELADHKENFCSTLEDIDCQFEDGEEEFENAIDRMWHISKMRRWDEEDYKWGRVLFGNRWCESRQVYRMYYFDANVNDREQWCSDC
tara:strand:+ start:636 stop:962 length:327 start_codon:yes stop_codon:yes gene_type:complete